MTKPINIQFLLLGLVLLFLGACEKDYSYTLPPKAPPKVSQPTSTLEAYYTNTAPGTLTAAYWKTANYLNVNAKNMSTNLLYGDGALNLTKTFAGLLDFNKGGEAKLNLKAAYDADYLYILAEWYDSTVNLSQHSWLYNGKTDPLKSTEPAAGWTSQRNSDKLAFAFDIAGAAGTAGTFSTVGCLASCHGSGSSAVMTPTSGTVDIWNWSLATSSPLGYVHDMNAGTTGFVNDAGSPLATRNSSGTTDRFGPAYEWDGTSQSVTLPNGNTTLLDPSYYLLNKTPMIGNAANGATLYNVTAGCYNCHGVNGSGGSDGATNSIAENKKSRAAYKESMDNIGDMAGYWGVLTAAQKDDLITFMRGTSGSPGYYLNTPAAGTSSADITVVTNVTPIQVTNAMFPQTNKHQKYQVLIKRKLKTNNADDVQFNLLTNKNYTFGVALMDDDGKNHIGSAKETLTFK